MQGPDRSCPEPTPLSRVRYRQERDAELLAHVRPTPRSATKESDKMPFAYRIEPTVGMLFVVGQGVVT